MTLKKAQALAALVDTFTSAYLLGFQWDNHWFRFLGILLMIEAVTAMIKLEAMKWHAS